MANAPRATTMKTRTAINAGIDNFVFPNSPGRALSDFGLRFKQGWPQPRTESRQPVRKQRTESSSAESSPHLSVFVDGTSFERENVLHDDGFVIHAGDLGNRDNFARAVRQ